MDKRFLIYEGFKKDGAIIFEELIKKFNFKIQSLSDSGIHFINNRCILDITYENSIQSWLKIPKYNISEMIPKLCMFKGDNVISEYRKIVMQENIKNELISLSHFLCTYFSDELSEGEGD